jgi:hypothetical protein
MQLYLFSLLTLHVVYLFSLLTQYKIFTLLYIIILPNIRVCHRADRGGIMVTA